MEKNIVVEENHQISDSNCISKSVESAIKIDSISIDLINANEKSAAENCEHFSIRGYVSEIRKKDWKICWPFASDGDSNKHVEQACGLPSLHVPKFRYWRCQNCLWDISAKGIGNDYGAILKSCNGGLTVNSICSHASALDDVAMLLSDFQQAPKLDILVEKKGDAKASVNLNNSSEYHPSPCIDRKEKKIEVANDTITGSGDVDQEMHRLTTEISCLMQKPYHMDGIDLCKPASGHHEVDAELAGNLNCMVKNSTKIYETGKTISVADQHKELTACGMLVETNNIEEACSADKTQVGGHPSPELDECDYASSESAEFTVGNNRQELHHDKSSGLHRRKTRKVRLLTELLCENGDGDIENVKTDDSLSNAIPDSSAAGDKLPVPQHQLAIQGNFRRGLCQNRKRKLDQDEDWRPLVTVSPSKACKEVRISKRFAESTDAIAKAFARMHLQASMKKQCTKRRVDRNTGIGKKKNKKALIFYESSSLVPIQEIVPNEIGKKTGDALNSNAVDGVLLKAMHNAVAGRKGSFFALSAQRMHKKPNFKKKTKMPQADDQQAAEISQNHGMLKEDQNQITRKDVEILDTGSVTVPFHSAQNTLGEKGPNLSFSSYVTSQRCDMQNNPQVVDRRISILMQQGSNTEDDQVNKKAADTKYVRNFLFASKSVPDMPFGKEGYSNLSEKRITDRMSFLDERQNYSSCVEIGSCSHMQQKNFHSASSNIKRVGIQEHSAFMRKDIDCRANKVPEQGALDDIPMEIVELMAKNQYERCRPDDTEYDRCRLEMTDNNQSGRMMDFNKAYGNGETSFIQQETTKKRNPHAKNGITQKGENVGPAKQKLVDYFSLADVTQLNMRKLQQTPTPAGLGPLFQYHEKPLRGVQHSASSSGRQNSAQNCKWIWDVVGKRSFHNCLQCSGTCNTCQNIQQNKETNNFWSSTMPNHMPFVYSIPQKCTATSANVLLNSSSSMHKENTNGNRELKFLNQNAVNMGKQNRNLGSETRRTCAEYPFSCKHNGIELNQKPMGSLDLYSNETIPAMDLLSLMDAGLRYRAPINLDITPKFQKRPATHDQDPKEFFRLDSGAYKATNIMKYSSYDYHDKNQLAEDSHGCIPTIPAAAGPSGSSFQHDKCFEKATDFTGQVAQEKVKGKISDLCMQNKGCRLQKSSPSGNGNFSTNCGSLPVHSMHKMFFGPSDSSLFPLHFRGLESSTKHLFEIPGGIQPVHHSSDYGCCSVNRNPADFSVPEAGNSYMIAGEDLKFGKVIPFSNGHRPTKLAGPKRQKKIPAVKEHRQHLV